MSNQSRNVSVRLSALWISLVAWCLMFFNAIRFARLIPVWAFVFGSVINFFVIGSLVVALRNAYREQRSSQRL